MYEIMDKQFQEEYSKFGVNKQTALDKTRARIVAESERVQGLSTLLKAFVNDLPNVFAVFEAQDRLQQAKTVEDQR